jgi:hypothetical protein
MATKRERDEKEHRERHMFLKSLEGIASLGRAWQLATDGHHTNYRENLAALLRFGSVPEDRCHWDEVGVYKALLARLKESGVQWGNGAVRDKNGNIFPFNPTGYYSE